MNNTNKNTYQIILGDCAKEIEKLKNINFDLSFLDPPFNQEITYENHDDDMGEDKYWEWMTDICQLVYEKTSTGGSIFFMQREKNTHKVLDTLLKSKWKYQNLIP